MSFGLFQGCKGWFPGNGYLLNFLFTIPEREDVSRFIPMYPCANTLEIYRNF
jgi:hypothetical protein